MFHVELWFTLILDNLENEEILIEACSWKLLLIHTWFLECFCCQPKQCWLIVVELSPWFVIAFCFLVKRSEVEFVVLALSWYFSRLITFLSSNHPRSTHSLASFIKIFHFSFQKTLLAMFLLTTQWNKHYHQTHIWMDHHFSNVMRSFFCFTRTVD